MTVAITAVVVVLLVLGVGLLIFALMRHSQSAVPRVLDERQESLDNVVGLDEQGQEIMASQEAPEPARDAAGFESLLQDEIRNQGREESAADDES